jgi:DNA-binding response OmpR family regulator
MYDKNILCVDDNKDSLELLKIFFEQADYQVVTCTNHQECFEHIGNNDFSAIILDCWLAEKDGFEICREIRAANASIPIIFYTADATAKSREMGLTSGANAYLVKPDDMGNLVPTVTQFLAQTHSPTGESYYLQNQQGC